jgi:hypothetical protein
MLSVPWWFRAAELIVPWGICSPILYIFHLWTNEILVSETKPRTDAFNLVKLLHLRYFSLSQSFYDNAIHCEWRLGSILSISAAAMYYICSILLCCMPRPTPCLGNGGDGDGNNNVGDVEKPARTEDERHSDSDHTTDH